MHTPCLAQPTSPAYSPTSPQYSVSNWVCLALVDFLPLSPSHFFVPLVLHSRRRLPTARRALNIPWVASAFIWFTIARRLNVISVLDLYLAANVPRLQPDKPSVLGKNDSCSCVLDRTLSHYLSSRLYSLSCQTANLARIQVNIYEIDFLVLCYRLCRADFVFLCLSRSPASPAYSPGNTGKEN